MWWAGCSSGSPCQPRQQKRPAQLTNAPRSTDNIVSVLPELLTKLLSIPDAENQFRPKAGAQGGGGGGGKKRRGKRKESSKPISTVRGVSVCVCCLFVSVGVCVCVCVCVGAGRCEAATLVPVAAKPAHPDTAACLPGCRSAWFTQFTQFTQFTCRACRWVRRSCRGCSSSAPRPPWR
jgi:hypothetical protein